MTFFVKKYNNCNFRYLNIEICLLFIEKNHRIIEKIKAFLKLAIKKTFITDIYFERTCLDLLSASKFYKPIHYLTSMISCPFHASIREM